MLPRAWIRLLMLVSIATFTFTLPANAQITSLSHSWGSGPVSRGSVAEIRGNNLSQAIQGIDSFANITTSLGGVTVEVDGIPSLIYYVSPQLIQFVVPDEVPPTRIEFIPKRPVKVYPQTLKVSGYQTHEYKFYLMDSAPWWNLSNGYIQGIVLSPTPPFLFAVIEKGVIPVSPGARVRLTASGARSFRPVDQQFFNILFLTEEGEWFETSCGTWKDPVIPGVDLVTWDIPQEWKGKKGFIFLQTPSNFSEGAKVEFQ